MQQLDGALPLCFCFRAIHLGIIDKIDKHKIGRQVVQNPQEIEMGQTVAIKKCGIKNEADGRSDFASFEEKKLTSISRRATFLGDR